MPKPLLSTVVLKVFVLAALACGLHEWMALTRSRWVDRHRARQRRFTGP